MLMNVAFLCTQSRVSITLSVFFFDVFSANGQRPSDHRPSRRQDSTAKCWDIGQRKLLEDLPGHADEDGSS